MLMMSDSIQRAGELTSMRIAYFDCFAGISGDMTLGALIDAGADVETIRHMLKQLPIGDFKLTVEKVHQHAITATRAIVHVSGESEDANAPSHHRRKLSDIRALLEASSLPDAIKVKALRAFCTLARAEATIHGTSIEDVHFHEVGAVDAIIDIVGALIALDHLGIDAVYASQLPYTHGRVQVAHGTLPVPAPAALEILKGAPWYPLDVDAELVTPTGAALLKTLCAGFNTFPPFAPQAIGYGAGERQLPFPNVLRVVIGETIATPSSDHPQRIYERMVLLETNLDDMPPEWFGHVLEKLFALGARDAFITPVQMKKNRPGAILSVLCTPDRIDAVLQCLFCETTTLGVRVLPVDRWSAHRETITVNTPYGSIRVKVARWAGKVVNVAPEYEDCRAVANAHNVPLKRIMDVARNIAYEQIQQVSSNDH